ncbi:MAG: ribonuclease H-like domain-containing protein [Bryobacterales bacterium]|nr:ribonuclease H-like domain-containing protein [Bryobacterales bacterium]
MGIFREELERLREKLRRVEARITNHAPAGLGNSDGPSPQRVLPASPDLPPWEDASDDAAFEQSLGRSTAEQPTRSGFAQRIAIEDCVSGSVVETPVGSHFEAETVYPLGSSHGCFAIQGLVDSPDDLLSELCSPEAVSSCERWVFLDTETTGLSGGSGTFAFLVGLGRISTDGFRVRQFFLREPSDEKSMLYRIAQELERSAAVITYNGKAFDLPLLETRYRLVRSTVPLDNVPHLDLLHACRRLWKLRYESCKLTHLEERVLGYERVGDVPGFLIPSLYTDYLRFGEAQGLAPVFVHNALDILSLACLTQIVARVFHDPSAAPVRHAVECIGLGRWLMQAGRTEDALPLLHRAANATIPEAMLARTLWDIFEIERRAGRYEAARSAVEQIVGFPNSLHERALEALSILYEHRLKNIPRALHYARLLESARPGEKSGARVERLVKKAGRARRGEIFER